MEREESPKVAVVLTANLIEIAADALTEAAELNGDSATDTVNRALQVYAFLTREIKAGKRVYLQDREGEMAQVTIL